MYRGISALPAGAYLLVERAGQPSIQYFCRVEDELVTATTSDSRSLPREEAQERLLATLTGSVSRHLVADVPVGVFLSAGIDSSVVTAFASESPQARLRTITLGFKEYRNTENDETALASKVAQHYATDHQTRWIAKSEFQQEMERVISAMDQPSIDGVNTYFVAKATHEIGLKAALSGIGGDELFGGYPSFKDVWRILLTGRSIPRPLGRVIRKASAPILKWFTSTKYAGIFEYGHNYGGAYLLRRALFMPWEIEEILQPDTAREGWQRLKIEQRLEGTACGILPRHLKVSALEISWYMRNQLLRDADWAGMANSVEIRTPLADIEVLRSVAAIASHGQALTSKGALAESPRKALPRAIIERRKTGFAVPVREWISQMGADPQERGLRGWALWLARKFNFEMKMYPQSEETPAGSTLSAN
jgi:asparagine synthase (glutamine-hydrolysing)